MIDNLDQVERLIANLKDALPISAALTERLAAYLRGQLPAVELPQCCIVTRVHYAGDAGGIMCSLDLPADAAGGVFVVSITHLAFKRTQPLAREIAAYQKRRLKRMRIVDGWHPSRSGPSLVSYISS